MDVKDLSFSLQEVWAHMCMHYFHVESFYCKVIIPLCSLLVYVFFSVFTVIVVFIIFTFIVLIWDLFYYYFWLAVTKLPHLERNAQPHLLLHYWNKHLLRGMSLNQLYSNFLNVLCIFSINLFHHKIYWNCRKSSPRPNSDTLIVTNLTRNVHDAHLREIFGKSLNSERNVWRQNCSKRL